MKCASNKYRCKCSNINCTELCQRRLFNSFLAILNVYATNNFHLLLLNRIFLLIIFKKKSCESALQTGLFQQKPWLGGLNLFHITAASLKTRWTFLFLYIIRTHFFHTLITKIFKNKLLSSNLFCFLVENNYF